MVTTIKRIWEHPYMDTTLVVLAWAAVIALVFGVVAGLVKLYGAAEHRTCFEKVEDLGVDGGDWGYWSGCRVEVNGDLVPLDNYRVSR